MVVVQILTYHSAVNIFIIIYLNWNQVIVQIYILIKPLIVNVLGKFKTWTCDGFGLKSMALVTVENVNKKI